MATLSSSQRDDTYLSTCFDKQARRLLIVRPQAHPTDQERRSLIQMQIRRSKSKAGSAESIVSFSPAKLIGRVRKAEMDHLAQRASDRRGITVIQNEVEFSF